MWGSERIAAVKQKALSEQEIERLEWQRQWGVLIHYFDTPLRRFLRGMGFRFKYDSIEPGLYNRIAASLWLLGLGQLVLVAYLILSRVH